MYPLTVIRSCPLLVLYPLQRNFYKFDALKLTNIVRKAPVHNLKGQIKCYNKRKNTVF